MLLYVTFLARIEQSNIVQCNTFRNLVALEAIILQWSDQVSLELTYTSR